MTTDERDKLILEMHGDIKVIKSYVKDHKSVHFRYTLMVWSAIVSAAVALFKSAV